MITNVDRRLLKFIKIRVLRQLAKVDKHILKGLKIPRPLAVPVQARLRVPRNIKGLRETAGPFLLVRPAGRLNLEALRVLGPRKTKKSVSPMVHRSQAMSNAHFNVISPIGEGRDGAFIIP